MKSKVLVLYAASLLFFLTELVSSPVSCYADVPFQIKFVPVKVNFDYECVDYNIILDIPEYGSLKLDDGVCAGTYSFGKRIDSYSYDRDEARAGIDTDTFHIMRVKDVVFVEWDTLLEGYYIYREWHVFRKNVDEPLIRDGIPIFGQWGAGTRLEGGVIVKGFSQERVELEITSKRTDVLHQMAPLHYYDPDGSGYVGTVILRKKISYQLLGDKAKVADGELAVLKTINETYQEIADYFGIKRKGLQAYDRWVALPMGQEKFKRIFYAHCDLPRSLQGLWE